MAEEGTDKNSTEESKPTFAEKAKQFIKEKTEQAGEYIEKKVEQAKEYNEREKPMEKIKEAARAAPRNAYANMQKAGSAANRNIDFNALGEDLSYLKEQAKSSGRNIGLSEKQSARKYGDVQFPTLFGGSGGMFDTPERERKIRQVDLFATQERYDPFTGERIPLNRNPIRYDPNTGLKIDRKFTPVSEHKKEIAKNKKLIDIFESERFMTDYEKAERKFEKEVKIKELEFDIKQDYLKQTEQADKETDKYNKQSDAIKIKREMWNKERQRLASETKKFNKIIRDPKSSQSDRDAAQIALRQHLALRRSTEDFVKINEPKWKAEEDTIKLVKDISKAENRRRPFREEIEIKTMKEKNKIVTGHDPLSLFTKPKGSPSEEMKRLRNLKKKKPKKLVYSYDVKIKDTFNNESPKRIKGIPYAMGQDIPFRTSPLRAEGIKSTIKQPRNILDNLTSQKFKDPFGSINVKPLKIKSLPVKKKKLGNINDAFNLFGKPKKGGIF